MFYAQYTKLSQPTCPALCVLPAITVKLFRSVGHELFSSLCTEYRSRDHRLTDETHLCNKLTCSHWWDMKLFRTTLLCSYTCWSSGIIRCMLLFSLPMQAMLHVGFFFSHISYLFVISTICYFMKAPSILANEAESTTAHGKVNK